MFRQIFYNSKTKNTLNFFWAQIRNYRSATLLVSFSMVVVSVADSIGPIFYKFLFDILSSGEKTPQVAGKAVWIVIGLLGVYLFQWLARRSAAFGANYLESQIIAHLSNDCFACLHHHSSSFLNNTFVGSLVKKVKWFTAAFENVADVIFWDIIPLAVGLIITSTVLFWKNFWLGLSMLIWLVVFLLVNLIFANYKIKFDLRRNEEETTNSGLLADSITNNVNVKLFNGSQREIDNFSISSGRLAEARRKSWNVGSYFDAFQGLLAIFLEIGIIIFAVHLWQQGVMSIGDFVMIQAYLINIFDRIWGIGNVLRRVFQSLSDAEEMTQILETPFEIKDIPGAKNLVVTEGIIEYHGVTFNYHHTRQIISNFDLKIASGEKVAFVGPSGAGKTTVIKLLLRMHNLTAGHIFIDGQDISQVTLESLWRNISLVSQDPILFHRSIRENIRYGRPEATNQEVEEAAKKARCHEFITRLENGYDSLVGERGIKLSGGERQRVAIARAILRAAPILVLDEATSSLDSHSEQMIQEALNELMKGKTVLVIAHRLSTIKNSDRIIAINKGQIAEEGNHKDLLAREKSLYKKLWQFQVGGFVK